jgi:peroxiredoxin
MSINVGDKIPSVTLKRLDRSGNLEEVHTDSMFAGRKVVVFSVPGAFTPTCSTQHLPSYIERAGELRAKGVDEIACLSVNDPWVMKAWSDQAGAGDTVSMLPDGNGELTRALGLELDGGAVLGPRGKRFSMLVEDGVVQSLHVESNAGKMEVSGADICLRDL